MKHRRNLRNLLLVVLSTLPIALLTSLAWRGHTEAGEISLVANIGERTLTVQRGDEIVKVYDVAVGTGRHPTPTGSYSIRKIVWNPAWIPPDRAWARDKVPQGPGDPENPMKVVKIFFQSKVPWPTAMVCLVSDDQSCTCIETKRPGYFMKYSAAS